MGHVLDQLPGWNGRHSSDYSTVPAALSASTDSPTLHDETMEFDSPPASAAHSSLSRFFANFTIGFADGLTVPFALTAGLSSLGQTNTVIYAGLAEICAGCISMGIGGYLAAKGEEKRESINRPNDLENEGRDNDEMKIASSVPLRQVTEVEDYLAPLRLPSHLLESVMAHIESTPETVERMRENLRLAAGESAPEPFKTSPLLSGLTVAVGYLLGGLIPLAPYFFVKSVTSGLIWSFCLCVLALFVFGFAKEYALHISPATQRWDSRASRHRLLQWKFIKHGLWEGFIMAALGGFAALTAVLCVKLFEGVVN